MSNGVPVDAAWSRVPTRSRGLGTARDGSKAHRSPRGQPEKGTRLVRRELLCVAAAWRMGRVSRRDAAAATLRLLQYNEWKAGEFQPGLLSPLHQSLRTRNSLGRSQCA